MKLIRILISFVIITALFGCESVEDRSVPDIFIGVWKTSEPKYSNSFIKFTQSTIIFGTEEGSVTRFGITKIKKEYEEGNIFFTIHYTNLEGQEYRFRFNSDINGEMIRLKNQRNIIWKKVVD